MSKSKYMVLRATPRKIAGLEIAGKPMSFGGQTNAFVVSDPGIAREIEAQHGPKAGGDVVIIKHDAPREAGHNYSFSVPALPWHKEKPQ